MFHSQFYGKIFKNPSKQEKSRFMGQLTTMFLTLEYSTQNLGTHLSPQNTPRPDKSTQQSEDTIKHNLCDENEPHTLPRVQVYAAS